MIEFLNEIYKLKDVIRYNTTTKLTQESVAEHSFFVAIIALHLCEKYKLNDDMIRQCIIKAILHDMPEMYINDITHDVKIKLNLYETLKPFEDKYYKTHYPKYEKLMCNNDNKVIDYIVELADILSVIQFCQREKSLGNKNKKINEIIYSSENRISELYDKLKIELGEKHD